MGVKIEDALVKGSVRGEGWRTFVGGKGVFGVGRGVLGVEGLCWGGRRLVWVA